MTDNNHLITPPTDLVIDWRLDPGYIERTEKVTMVTMTTGRLQYIATQAARWGADTELDACCQYISRWFATPEYRAAELRAARRPKPPSLKEQALTALDQADKGLSESEWQQRSDTIRRALESLPD